MCKLHQREIKVQGSKEIIIVFSLLLILFDDGVDGAFHRVEIGHIVENELEKGAPGINQVVALLWGYFGKRHRVSTA